MIITILIIGALALASVIVVGVIAIGCLTCITIQ